MDYKNPPVLLSCGHVISAEALDGIVSNRTSFKCPICPETMTAEEVRPLRIDPQWNENPNENENRASRYRFGSSRNNNSNNGNTSGGADNGSNRRRFGRRR